MSARKVKMPALFFVMLLACGRSVGGAESTRIDLGAPASNCEVRYHSGPVTYVEDLLDGRFVSRCWSIGDRADRAKFWREPAFEIRVKTEPSPAAVPGRLLDSGWQWIAVHELPATRCGARHAVVELAHAGAGIRLEVHTLLDGTAILIRYLRITNRAAKPMALTGLAPWAGRLWAQDAPFALGHTQRWQNQFEDWFAWQVLKPGANIVAQTRGLTAAKPFFALRNDATGQYAIGGLGWPVNYCMEFCQAHGLTFKVGPTSVNALRVIDAGETITTPAVHLGLIAGDFDAAVQAVHQHVRRSVCPPIKPELAHRAISVQRRLVPLHLPRRRL